MEQKKGDKDSLVLRWGMAEQLRGKKNNFQVIENECCAEASLCNELYGILADKEIRTVFQPIVSLADGNVIGYEALSRGPVGGKLERPDVLFKVAEECGMVWEIDYLCRTAAIERATSVIGDKNLFINVDPQIINDERFRKGHTRELLEMLGLRDGQIVFEITERSAVADFNSFRKVLEHYATQGYKIAIDDAGAGHSGLRLLAETRPQFVKIDMELVRNIDKDSLKRALMKAFCEFSMETNIRIIAEGIETLEELNTLIDVGVHYGQGYYLQRPAAQLLDVSTAIREDIAVRNAMKRAASLQTPLTMPIGELARKDAAFPLTMLGYQFVEHFNANPKIMGVAVVENGRPVGLVMRDRLFGQLGTQYGVAVYMNRKIHLLMDNNPLIVDYEMPLEQVTSLAMGREDERIYDYIIVTRDGCYFGITTVKDLLGKTTQLEINRAKHCNPLTGLPGNLLIEGVLQDVIKRSEPYAVLYFDLDNFKAYNDIYGFENGDKILGVTAQVIQEKLLTSGRYNFVGHIGGDDFVAVMHDGDLDGNCKEILEEFDRRILGYYNERDLEQGFILAKNRHGVEERFPLMALSIAVITNRYKQYKNTLELTEHAAVVKKQCKLQWNSCYVTG